MMKIKRVISIIAAISLLISMCTFSSVYAQPVDFVGENALDLLTKLNIDVTAENKKLTRTDFVTLVLQTVGQLDYTNEIGESYFVDVGGVISGIINTATDLGYIKKSSDGLFRPNDFITFEEAVVICVRVLGYDYVAEDGYSFLKYYNIANRLDLTDGVDSADFDDVSVNILLVNTLNAQCADTIYAENKIDINKMSLMEAVYGISRYTGTVEALNGVAITGADTASEGKIRIDGKQYSSDKVYNTDEFLGNIADCYITSIKGSEKLFAMYKYSEGQKLELFSEDIISVSDDMTSLRYYLGNSQKTARLSSDISVVYNNSKKFNVSGKDFTNENSKIVLSDGNEDGVFETAVIEKPEYYKIAVADASDMYIGSFNGKAALELENLSDESLLEIVKDDGTAATIGDIKKGTFAEVLYSKNNVGAIDYTKAVKIVILSGTVSGKINSVDKDGYVCIEDKEYLCTTDILPELTLGTGAVFYMGTNGKLIGISDTLPDSNSYGYLVGVKRDSGLSANVSAKIFTQKGEMKILSTGEKVNYTGYVGTEYVERQNTDAAKLTEYITDGQLIRFYADADGILRNIVCAYNYTNDDSYEGCDDTKFTLEYHNKNGRYYNLVASENHYYSTDSIIFNVPENGEDRDYSVGAYTDYPELNNVDIKLYDSDSAFVCKVGVMTSSSTLSAEFTDEELGDQNIAVISKKYRMIQGEDEVTAFKAYCMSKEVTLTAKRDDLHDAKVSVPSQGEKSTIYFRELNPGDVIQYRTDAQGKVILINVLHRFNKNDLSSKYYTQQANQGYLSIMITQAGLVDRYVPDGFFTVADSDGKKYNFSDKRIMYHIYIFDTDTGEVEVVNPLTYLIGSESSEPDYVFVKCRRTSLRDLVVYR